MVKLSFINMKGGVGKTTIAGLVGEYMASYYGQKTLLIDLDPQINLTLSFVDEEAWGEKNNKDMTLTRLFRDYIEKKSFFDFDKVIFKDIGKLRDKTGTLDLLPCSPSLAYLQERLYEFVNNPEGRDSVEEILVRELGYKLKAYRNVIIDSPPNLGLVSRNGLRLSDFYLIPVIPNYLSTYGIPELLKEIGETYSIKKHSLGIIISKYSSNNNTHKKYVSNLEVWTRTKNYPEVLHPFIKNSAILEREVEIRRDSNWINGPTSGQLLGYGDIREEIQELTGVILERAGK